MTEPVTCTTTGCTRPVLCRGVCRPCYDRAYYVQRPSLVPKVCRRCGAAYAGRGWIYCSPSCAHAAELEAPRNRRPNALVCPTCGRAFAARWGQRFCSLACRPHRGPGTTTTDRAAPSGQK
jgi:predicted nucleic acid-binding Zn ribbon protein